MTTLFSKAIDFDQPLPRLFQDVRFQNHLRQPPERAFVGFERTFKSRSHINRISGVRCCSAINTEMGNKDLKKRGLNLCGGFGQYKSVKILTGNLSLYNTGR